MRDWAPSKAGLAAEYRSRRRDRHPSVVPLLTCVGYVVPGIPPNGRDIVSETPIKRRDVVPTCVGIRREDKGDKEQRTPLIPMHVRLLVEQGVRVIVQPSPTRIHSDDEYAVAGAELSDDLGTCNVVLAVKEIPETLLERGKTYVFFSHTLKGQPHNMPMLRKILGLGCTLIDWECIRNRRGRRLVGFGRFAGLAGMIDTLWALGQRLEAEGIESPFATIRQAWTYKRLYHARLAVAAVGRRISEEGLPHVITPLVFGIVGYGNVSGGVQEILDLLPFRFGDPERLSDLRREEGRHVVYKTILSQENCYEHVKGSEFNLKEYLSNPELYRENFSRHLPHLTAIINTIYWEPRFPRLISRQNLRDLYGGDSPPHLRVISDITCDIEGSVECTLRATTPEDPTYVYLPETHEESHDWSARGPVVLAVDNLPAEVPRESSEEFSRSALPFTAQIANSHGANGFQMGHVTPALREAVIAYRGELMPGYAYLKESL